MKFAVLLLVFLCSYASPVAAKRKAKGPTLAETTDYIVQILNVDGHTWSPGASIPGLVTSSSTTLSNARASGCLISYDVGDELSGVTEKIGFWKSVTTYSVVLDLQSTVAKSVWAGNGGVSVRLSSPINLIKHTKDENGRTSERTEQVTELHFILQSSDSAERLGNALNYAIGLCGGGKVDPFKPR